jgi:nitrogen fixation NifU-like protein
MPSYSTKVIDHFMNPRNSGTLEGENAAVGRVGNQDCGDLVDIYIMVGEDDTIQDIKFQTFGCAAAIATSSVITELAAGLPLPDAYKISRQDVADALDGLPPGKMLCSNLAPDALRIAINSFLKRHGRETLGPDAEIGACEAGDDNKPEQD